MTIGMIATIARNGKWFRARIGAAPILAA